MIWSDRYWVVTKWNPREGKHFYIVVDKKTNWSANMIIYKYMGNAIRAAKRLFEKEMNEIEKVLLGE